MKIKLLAYDGEEHWVRIPDDTEKVVIDLVSGDMILTDPIYYDTGENREMNFKEGSFTIEKEYFKKLND